MFNPIPPGESQQQAETASSQQVDQLTLAAYDFAERRLAAGASSAEIETELIKGGFGKELSAAVANDPELGKPKSGRLRRRGMGQRSAAHYQAASAPIGMSELQAAGRRNMLVGGLWCAGGLIVTLVTLAVASGGGTYIIAWGAILFGAIQFFRGLSQVSGH